MCSCGEEHPGCTEHRKDGRPCGGRPFRGDELCPRHRRQRRTEEFAARIDAKYRDGVSRDEFVAWAESDIERTARDEFSRRLEAGALRRLRGSR